VLAFQGVKSVDDSARFRAVSIHAEESEAPWEKDFHADTLAGTFWSILESLPGEGAGPNDVRDRFYVFNLFADGIHRDLREPFRPYAVFDDTAAMIQGILAEDADEDRLLQVAALDPFLTLDVLCLANALRIDRKALVGTAREGSHVLGSKTFREFLDLLTGPAAPKTPPSEKVERLVRRSALSTAVAATHVAASFGIDLETGYTLGLLEPMAVEALLKLLMVVDFPSGPFRAAALERFRPLFGRMLARKLNLPRMHEDVLGSEGRVTATSPAPEQLIFAAKQLSRAEQIGREWSSDDPAMADRFAGIAATPDLSEKIARDTGALREILQL